LSLVDAMKSFLFILRKPPHNGTQTQETLDVIFTAAAFDQAVSLLILDDGVFQLKTNQQAEIFGIKDTTALFKALEVYDVRNIYVETESLSERGLTPENLFLTVTELPRSHISRFLSTFELVFPS